MKIIALLKSRRAWVSVGTVVFTTLAPGLGLTSEQALAIAGTVAAWVLSDGMKDTK